ncbi:MAG: hypothetical protein ACTSX8_02845, partial [Alphaproteobacteria bacterium]
QDIAHHIASQAVDFALAARTLSREGVHRRHRFGPAQALLRNEAAKLYGIARGYDRGLTYRLYIRYGKVHTPLDTSQPTG